MDLSEVKTKLTEAFPPRKLDEKVGYPDEVVGKSWEQIDISWTGRHTVDIFDNFELFVDLIPALLVFHFSAMQAESDFESFCAHFGVVDDPNGMLRKEISGTMNWLTSKKMKELGLGKGQLKCIETLLNALSIQMDNFGKHNMADLARRTAMRLSEMA